MFCKACGTNLPDGIKFCTNCGDPILGSQISSKDLGRLNQTYSSSSTKNSFSQNIGLLIGGFIAMVLLGPLGFFIGLLVGIYCIYKGVQEGKN